MTLKTCPFCGSVPRIRETDAHWTQIECEVCGCRTPLLADREKVISIWERRKGGRVAVWNRQQLRPLLYTDIWECVACGGEFEISSDSLKWKYCPKCGARIVAKEMM